MKLFTLGFTRRSAENFFSTLGQAGVTRLVDVRISNTSQLAGFTKKDDLAYFTRTLCGIPYEHQTALAPTEAMLRAYSKGETDWENHSRAFLALMAERQVEKADPASFDGACLLCSEAEAHQCHRSLAAEYLAAHWRQQRGSEVEIIHL